MIVLAIAPWVGSSTVKPIVAGGTVPANPTFIEMVRNWAWVTSRLTIKTFLIIMTLLILLEILKTFVWIHPVVRTLSPFPGIMELVRKTGFLWVAAIIFGLSYGGAVIAKETKNNCLNREELELLQLFLGTNHAMVEDPPIFLPFAIHPLRLHVPRLVTAAIIVQFLRSRQRRFRGLPQSG